MTSLRVLTWHVHGSYLHYLGHVPVTWLLPVTPGREPGYGGRGHTFAWPDSVVEVAAEQVRDLDLDVVLTQSRQNWEHDRHLLLGDRVHKLPRVHVEHDPPPSWPNDAVHPVQDPAATLVHVTPYNALMWDSGITPSVTIDHGVAVPEVEWTGQDPVAVSVVNNLYQRGRRLGPDVFDAVAAQVPVDLAGMNGGRHPRWLGDVPLAQLHARLGRYRAFLHPIRYTSLGLAVLEAMALGLPVVGLATTELVTVVRNGENGWIETDPSRLAGHLRRLLADHDEATALSVGARRTVADQFGIDRFARDWLAVLQAAAGSGP